MDKQPNSVTLPPIKKSVKLASPKVFAPKSGKFNRLYLGLKVKPQMSFKTKVRAENNTSIDKPALYVPIIKFNQRHLSVL